MKGLVCGIVLLFASMACGGGGCVQVQITKDADYYSVQCPTQAMTDKCTVGQKVGTLTPKDSNGKDNVFLSTGEWHLSSTASGGASEALSGTQDDVIMNGSHYVVDANNARLIMTNNSCQ